MGLNGRLALRSSLLVVCLLALSACVTGPRFANLDAVIVPTEPLDLPPSAELTVRLEDVTRGSDVIAVSTYMRLGRGPIPVMLRYDAKAIDEDRTYVLRADIRSNKTLTHRNAEEVPVLTGEAPRNDVRVPIERIDGWQLGNDDLNEIERIVDKHVKDPVGPEFMAPPSRND